MGKMFKTTLFGGFRKGDVINYLEVLSHQRRIEAARLDDELDQLQKQNEELSRQLSWGRPSSGQQRGSEFQPNSLFHELNESRNNWQAREALLLERIQKLEDTCEALEKERDVLDRRGAALEAEKAALVVKIVKLEEMASAPPDSSAAGLSHAQSRTVERELLEGLKARLAEILAEINTITEEEQEQPIRVQSKEPIEPLQFTIPKPQIIDPEPEPKPEPVQESAPEPLRYTMPTPNPIPEPEPLRYTMPKSKVIEPEPEPTPEPLRYTTPTPQIIEPEPPRFSRTESQIAEPKPPKFATQEPQIAERKPLRSINFEPQPAPPPQMTTPESQPTKAEWQFPEPNPPRFTEADLQAAALPTELTADDLEKMGKKLKTVQDILAFVQTRGDQNS